MDPQEAKLISKPKPRDSLLYIIGGLELRSRSVRDGSVSVKAASVVAAVVKKSAGASLFPFGAFDFRFLVGLYSSVVSRPRSQATKLDLPKKKQISFALKCFSLEEMKVS